MLKQRAYREFMLAFAMIAMVGCGEGGANPNVTGSMEEATVKGIVRLRGKPVTNGIISFRGSNIYRPQAALKEGNISKDGTYEVRPYVGQNFVDVTCRELATPKNRQLIENEQMINIKPGEQIIDIHIPPLTGADATTE